MDDHDGFAVSIAERVAAIPGVVAVTLGGSRAQGTHRHESDWDFGLYYRHHLDPDHLRPWAGPAPCPPSVSGAAG